MTQIHRHSKPDASDTCAGCGNPVDIGMPVCPHCGSYERIETERRPGIGRPRSVDLGHRRLAAAEAVRRLQIEVERSVLAGERFLRVVHGHGASGRGGVIRRALRGELARMRSRKRVAGFIAGELLSGDSNEGRAFAARYPEARSWPDWNAANEGVTLIALL